MNAIVTGYSSGIGAAIVEKFEAMGYNVFTLTSRLENNDALENEVKQLLRVHDIDILVNCAGIGVFEPHEELSSTKIQELIAINLTAPILLTNLTLRSLKKTRGHIINITSVEATRHSKFSATYTATKAGLRNFSLALFEEVRKAGVRVTSINPDITDTNFFGDLKFKPSKKEQSYLISHEIAQSVVDIINQKGVVTDITVRPQYFAIEKK